MGTEGEANGRWQIDEKEEVARRSEGEERRCKAPRRLGAARGTAVAEDEVQEWECGASLEVVGSVDELGEGRRVSAAGSESAGKASLRERRERWAAEGVLACRPIDWQQFDVAEKIERPEPSELSLRLYAGAPDHLH